MDTSLLKQLDELLREGHGAEAIRLLQQHPAEYNYIVNQVYTTLMSYPNGHISDLNGTVWSTKQLADEVRRGIWRPVTYNFLLSEVDLLLKQAKG